LKIVLASANKGKIKEFERLLPNDEIVAFSEILGKIEIDEDKDTFKGNLVARLTRKEIERKLKILDEIAEDLKGKSTPKKNYYTINNLHSVANERFKLENLTVISPSSMKGLNRVNYLEKYSVDVESFKHLLKSGKDTIIPQEN
jgi:hypothetical protein